MPELSRTETGEREPVTVTITLDEQRGDGWIRVYDGPTRWPAIIVAEFRVLRPDLFAFMPSSHRAPE